MFKNVASQKIIVFAFDSTTNTPKSGDAANITCYVSKDYGAVTVLGDTSATELDATNCKGFYLFDLTQAETNADTLLFSAKSSTSNIVVVGAPATVFTLPPNFTKLAVDSTAGGVTLSDAVSHGGTLGSSTATLALKTINITNSAGDAIIASSTGSNGNGVNASGNGTGMGVLSTGGATGNGLKLVGGATSGDALLTSTTSGHGATFAGTGTAKNGINATGAAAATTNAAGHGISATGGAASTGVGGTSGAGINVTGGAGAASVNGAGNGLSSTGGGVTTVAGGHGALLTGTSTGNGLKATSGADAVLLTSTSGHGLNCTSSSGGKSGAILQNTSASATAASNGLTCATTGTTSHGISTTGGGTGAGILSTGGATGNGVLIVGGGTSGDGILVNTTSGHGATFNGSGASNCGICSNGANASGANAGGPGFLAIGGAASTSGGGTSAAGIKALGGAGAASTNGASEGLACVGGGTTTVSGGAGITSTGTGNKDGAAIAGAGSGNGLKVTGGLTGHGFSLIAGATSGNGMDCSVTSGIGFNLSVAAGSGINVTAGSHGVVVTAGGNGVGLWLSGSGAGQGLLCNGGSTDADGMQVAGGGNGNGLKFIGGGSGAGLLAQGGSTGPGAKAVGGSSSGAGLIVTTTSGDGIQVTPTAGHGLNVTANGSGKHGALVTGGTNGDGARVLGTGTGHGLNAQSGSGATGNGINAISNATAGHGLVATGSGTGHGVLATSGSGATGDGFRAVAVSTNGSGITGVGTGTGFDLNATSSPLQTIRVNLCQAGSTSTTIVLDASASAVTDLYKGEGVSVISGTGAGQHRTITAYDGTTKTATVDWAWTTTPDATSAFALAYGSAPKLDSNLNVTANGSGTFTANVTQWNGVNVATPNVAGVPIVDVGYWLGTAVTAATAGIPDVNAKRYNNQVTQTDANNLPKVDAEDWNGTPITTVVPNTNSVTVTTNNDKTGYSLTSGERSSIATTIWTDTTAGDFAVTSSPGKILVTQLGGTFTTTSSSVFSAAALANAPTGASAPAIATAVWQDATAGDFTVAGSIGKSLFTGGVVPGGSGGLFIAGSNAATTVNITGNITGNLSGSVGSIATNGISNASFAADTGKQTIRSNTATAGAATTLTLDAGASAVNNFYNNDILYLTGGTGVGQARFVTAYNGTTKVATVDSAWATTPDGTTTFAILPFDSVPGSVAPTAAQNATAVWTDLLAGSDFATVGSIGLLLKTNVDALISSRLAPTVAGRTLDVSAGGAAGLDWANVESPTTTVALTNTTISTSQVVASVTGSVGSVVATVNADLVAAGMDNVVIETGLNARQALSIIGASASGVLSGAVGPTVTIKGAGVATTRIVATVDSFGDRTSVTLTPPA